MKVDVLNGKVNKTFFTMLFSAIASTIVSTIYSTVDMICVGHYSGPDGAAAIACINPLWALMFAFGVISGVGGAVMMSNRRGSGDNRAANEYFTIATIIAGIFAVILFVTYTFFTEPLLILFGAEGNVLKLAVDYMQSLCFSVPTFTLCACLATFMRNDGEAVIPTVATIIGGILNIVLDILLVFTFDMGIKGAGLATGIGQFTAFIIIVSYFFTKKCNLSFTKPLYLSDTLIKIITVGFSAFLIEITSGITSAVHNIVIMENLSSSHLAVYGTASTVVIMFYCLFNGIGTALQPMVATAFGAGNTKRIKKTLRLSFITAAVMGITFFAVCEAFPEAILKIYMDVDDTVLEIGPRIVRIYSSALPIMGIGMVCNYYFQSTLHRTASVFVSMLRGLFLPVALVLTIPQALGYDYLWLSTPSGEIVTCAISILMLIPMLKRLTSSKSAEKEPVNEQEEKICSFD